MADLLVKKMRSTLGVKEHLQFAKTGFVYANLATSCGRKTTKMTPIHIIDSLSLSHNVSGK